MYAQFLGNYLLNKEYVTSEQLIEALQYQKSVHLKMGVLAIHAGYMNSKQVEEVHIAQTRKDGRFGELAVEAGFLTEEQVTELLNSQKPDYLLLSQALVDKGFITTADFEKAMKEYQEEYSISDSDFADAQSDKVAELIENFYQLNGANSKLQAQYITLLFNNIIRFIGKDFTPQKAMDLADYKATRCVIQKIAGDFNAETAIDMDINTAIAFASRYAGEDFTEDNEFVQASVEDFMNLNNGLYVVNLSNESSIESSLEPPVTTTSVPTASGSYFLIPITFPFGTVHFILSK